APIDSIWIDDEILLDCAQQGIWRHNQFVPLTARAYRFLLYFVHHPRQIIPIPQLLHIGWPDEMRTPRDLYGHIYRLRRVIESDPRHPRLLVTRRDAGYLWTAIPHNQMDSRRVSQIIST
ncbi:MAG: hypothetical protein C7B47_18160, partial [Sulfobacillus thermosulfidooxidans]